MPFLIDGNNLIGHIPDLRLDDPESRHRLAAWLRIFQKIRRMKILLVFDGPPDLDLIGGPYSQKKFRVFFPGPGEKADGIIQDLISQQTDKRRFFVVTSDREIQSFARDNRAKVMTCDEFHRMMKQAMKAYRSSKRLKKPEHTLSPLEVEHWLGLFSSDEA
ncbi:MAG: NYN domain-containing protein [Candidatus Aminicenantales bacterium]